MKQTHLALIIGLCAVVLIILMVMIQRQPKPFADDVGQNIAPVTQQQPSDPQPLPPPPAINQQNEEMVPFNGQEPTIAGRVSSLSGNRMIIDVVEQPKEGSTLVTVSYEIQLSAQTNYEFSPPQFGQPVVLADRSDLAAGDSVTVFVENEADLNTQPIQASRIRITKAG